MQYSIKSMYDLVEGSLQKGITTYEIGPDDQDLRHVYVITASPQATSGLFITDGIEDL